MEVIKVLDDLEKIGECHQISFYNRLASIIGNQATLKVRIYLANHLRIRENDIVEFRSNYQYLCDWIYGWNVVVPETMKQGNEENPFSIAKEPRRFSFAEEGERVEAEKLVRVFEHSADGYAESLRKWLEEVEKWIQRFSVFRPNVEETTNNASKDDFPKLRTTQSFGMDVSDAVNDGMGALQSGPTEYDMKTLDQIYSNLDVISDYTIMRVVCSLISLGLAEAIQSHEIYTSILVKLHESATEFICKTFQGFSDALAKDFAEDALTFTELRDSNLVKAWIKKYATVFDSSKSAAQQSDTPEETHQPKMEGVKPLAGRLKIPNMYVKFQFISKLLSSIDIFLFPTGVLAHRRGVKSFQYSYLNSQFWMTGGYDGLVKIYDIQTQQCYAQYAGHRSIVTDIKVMKKDTHIISVSFDRTIKIWNVQTAACEKTLTGHADGVTSCDISPDQRLLATSSLDMTARIWDIASGKCVATVKKHTKWIKVVRFSPDGMHLATASMDHKVYIWDLKIVLSTKNMTYTRCIDAHQDSVLSIVLSKPSLLLTSSRDQTVKMFDYLTGSELYSISLSPSWACTVAFNHDSQLFATGSFDNTIYIFKTKNGEKLRQLRVFNTGILCVGFPDNEDYVMCGTSDGFLQQIPL